MTQHNVRTQAQALAMAVLVTLAMLGSVNHLATSPAPAGLLAQTAHVAHQV
jgi:hypothetical protein